MKNIFCFRLYKEGLKKTRLLGIACAAVTIVFSALKPLIELFAQNKFRFGGNPEITVLDPFGFAPAEFCVLLFTPFFFYSMFSFLNKRNESDFYHAIPFKRTTVFVSFASAVYTWLWGTVIASVGINAMLWSFCKYYTFSFSVVPQLVGVMVFGTLYFGGFALLAITLTGTLVSSLALTAVLGGLFRVVSMFFTTTLEEMVPYVDQTMSFLQIFSIRYWFPVTLLNSFFNGFSIFRSAFLWIFSSAVVVATHGLAVFFYRRRKSEIASKSAPSKRLQHVFRCAFTLPFALLAVFSLQTGSDFGVAFIFAIIALLVYFLYELITTKSIKSTVKCAPWLLLLALVCGVYSGVLYGTQAIIRNESASVSDIRSVGLYERKVSLFDIDMYGSDDYETLCTKDISIPSERAKQIVSKAWERTKESESFFFWEGYTSRDVLITRPSGRTIGRSLTFTLEEAAELEMLMTDSPEYREQYLRMPKKKEILSLSVYTDFTEVWMDVGTELWDTLLSEYERLSDDEKIAFKQGQYGEAHHYTVGGSGMADSEQFTYQYFVPDSFTETVRKLDEMIREKIEKDFDAIRKDANGLSVKDPGTLSLYGEILSVVIFKEESGKEIVKRYGLNAYCSPGDEPDAGDGEKKLRSTIALLEWFSDKLVLNESSLDAHGIGYLTVEIYGGEIWKNSRFSVRALTEAEADELRKLLAEVGGELNEYERY